MLNPNPAAETGATTPQTPAPASTTTTPAVDPTEGFKLALAKHSNDAASLARTAYADAERLRTELAETRGKLPAKGAAVLEGDDLTAWKDLSKFGSLSEIKAKLVSGEESARQVSAFERKERDRSVASSYGFDPDVLGDMAKDLEIEIKDGQRNGKAAKVAEVVIKTVDDKGQEVITRTELSKYAEKNWAKYLPALRPGNQASRPTGPGTGRPAATTTTRTTEGNPAPRKRISF